MRNVYFSGGKAKKKKEKLKNSLLSKYALPEYYLHNQNEFIYFINLSRDEVIEHKRMYYPIMIFYKLRNISISFQITSEILRIIILLQTAPGTFQKNSDNLLNGIFLQISDKTFAKHLQHYFKHVTNLKPQFDI